eukprot:10222802-Heterocapsa_arctica.AAC.1
MVVELPMFELGLTFIPKAKAYWFRPAPGRIIRGQRRATQRSGSSRPSSSRSNPFIRRGSDPRTSITRAAADRLRYFTPS